MFVATINVEKISFTYTETDKLTPGVTSFVGPTTYALLDEVCKGIFNRYAYFDDITDPSETPAEAEYYSKAGAELDVLVFLQDFLIKTI